MARLIALLLALHSAVASATLAEYVEDNPDGSADKIALGFPVPTAVSSTERFDGFRAAASLTAQLERLALASPVFAKITLGNSLQGREIAGYIFGRSPQEGCAAMLQVGGVHAREWAAPEAVAHVAERLVEDSSAGGIAQYLADHSCILLAPIMNPDGFSATQKDATFTRINEEPGTQNPRDGRQRRKNLRDSDGDVQTAADTLLGVDLNRNIGPYWNTSARSSSDPRSIVYQGLASASEPETHALQSAAELLGHAQMRLFIDTHSFMRSYLLNRTDNARLNALTQQLAQLMARVPARDYGTQQEDPRTGGYGANDEYFAFEIQVPSYTLELEPGNNQAAEYGGNAGVRNSGFLLPESEIARVREETWQMAQLGFYRQAGPPHVQQVRIVDETTDELILQAIWQDQDAASRTLALDPAESLHSGRRYRLELQFSKPMRQGGPSGDAALYFPEQSLPLNPGLRLIGDATQELSDAGTWSASRYSLDTYTLSFAPQAGLGAKAALAIDVRDLSEQALDANPATTVNWAAGHWQGYEDPSGQAGDTGGTDSQITISVTGSAPPASGGGSGSPGLWLLALAAMTRRKHA